MKNILFIVVLCVLTSCKTTKVETPVEVKESHSEYIEKTKIDTFILRDSIYTKDSIYIKDKGDTVFVYNTKILYKYKTEYKYKDRVDTIAISDTIPQVTTLTKETLVYKMYWWQLGFMYLGIVTLILLIIYLIIKIKL